MQDATGTPLTEDPVSRVLAETLGAERTEAVLKKFSNYSNQPNAVKGASKLPADPALEDAALRVFDDPELGTLESLDSAGSSMLARLAAFDHTRILWALLALAARSDVTVLDRISPELAESAAPKIASIRRAVKKHAVALANPVPQPSPDADLPASLAKVAGWLKEHPEADPRVFAPHAKQKAAARKIAMRALGTIATPAAFEVLKAYSREDYALPEIAELHRAWGRFDRREFAAAMFHPNAYALDLDSCSNLDGIGAVEGLSGLKMHLNKTTDMSPLTECTELERLIILVEKETKLSGLPAVFELPKLRELEYPKTPTADESDAIAGSNISVLQLRLQDSNGRFLLDMPRLRRLTVSLGTEQYGESPTPHPDLPETLLQLASLGVQVTTYQHERDWVESLATEAEARGFAVERARGYVIFTSDPADAA